MKSGFDDDPSALSVSVVDGEYTPPRRRTDPDWSCQQRCSARSSLKVTGKALNVPAPSNREQDFCSEPRPPQARFPHKDKAFVASGMSPILQLRPDLGLKISAVLIPPPVFVLRPPTVRIPACKNFAIISQSMT